ncbi:28S ribosomal protein S34, mitochondrial [Aricia agestis]|uniref:28S ribosomal protein S34, mitochondrial n=1 Tax=Aricia agestis TaxID=91739 RepID=UPI001C202E42|nr:28S ribosomal protein S34, mitochondrial [Aricia agestis]XP_041986235.1 28S ribosomal protein S34, mitochondrial [Aricia agestis]
MANNTIIKYVGRTTDFRGKTLWEIIGRLKDYGVGRIVVRSVFERYPEPSFMRIVKVETCPDEERRRVRVWVEKTFRGYTHDKLTEIYRTSYKPDYKLIPKHEEEKLINSITNKHHFSDVILPNKIEMPPLMKEFIVKDHERKGLKTLTDFEMPLRYNYSPNRVMRIAKGDEKPTVKFTMGLGKPVSLSLYAGVQLLE